MTYWLNPCGSSYEMSPCGLSSLKPLVHLAACLWVIPWLTGGVRGPRPEGVDISTGSGWDQSDHEAHRPRGDRTVSSASGANGSQIILAADCMPLACKCHRAHGTSPEPLCTRDGMAPTLPPEHQRPAQTTPGPLHWLSPLLSLMLTS